MNSCPPLRLAWCPRRAPNNSFRCSSRDTIVRHLSIQVSSPVRPKPAPSPFAAGNGESARFSCGPTLRRSFTDPEVHAGPSGALAPGPARSGIHERVQRGMSRPRDASRSNERSLYANHQFVSLRQDTLEFLDGRKKGSSGSVGLMSVAHCARFEMRTDIRMLCARGGVHRGEATGGERRCRIFSWKERFGSPWL